MPAVVLIRRMISWWEIIDFLCKKAVITVSCSMVAGVYMYVYMCACVCMCVCVYVYECVCVGMYVCIYGSIYGCIYGCMYDVCVYVHRHLCACRYECLLRRWLPCISNDVLCICPLSVSANPSECHVNLLLPGQTSRNLLDQLQKSTEIFKRKVSPFVK